jgi:hypothetical protein
VVTGSAGRVIGGAIAGTVSMLGGVVPVAVTGGTTSGVTGGTTGGVDGGTTGGSTGGVTGSDDWFTICTRAETGVAFTVTRFALND